MQTFRNHPLSRRSFTSRLAASLLLPAGAAGLTPRPLRAAPPHERRGRVVVGLSQEPTVFNPLFPHIEVDDGVHMNLFSPLWSIDNTGAFVPELAAAIPTTENGGISADGTFWRITLRPDVFWHDGAPFTAEDVRFTLALLHDPDFPAYSRSGHELTEEITVTSPTEITWRMKENSASYISALANMFIVPSHLLAHEHNWNTSSFSQSPVGTGPFRWESRIPGDQITLSANPRYYRPDEPHIETLIFKYIPDQTALFTQFEVGAIDYLGMQGIAPDRYREALALPPGHRIELAPAAATGVIALNLGRPCFQDPAVRQALYLALNKEEIIAILLEGIPHVTESYVPRESFWFSPDLPAHRHDPAQARALLDAAGWRPGPDGVRSRNGVRLEFSNSSTSGDPLRQQIQQVMQAQWQEIGAAMSLHDAPPAITWGTSWTHSQFDSALVEIDFMVGADPECSLHFDSHQSVARGGTGGNVFQYASPEADRLMAAGMHEQDRMKRRDIYRKIQALIRQDLPILPLYQRSAIEGIKSALTGYANNINVRSNCWNIRSWYWT
ncbi:peptide ABC transporter substrate-binding protein [Acetobacter musti]|uniref:Peptide ABC transporter substrate-binding protein n=1 Tax=Acetobacter musti TaxID=864732 RepID=A0ABX0JKJ4_9PROT|nr:peptide ABC transporter substrate-binding protein [Acetobacter musti]NHN83230.1 peptide ABC transporter substrate-binding protein [Acetobacter musti]